MRVKGATCDEVSANARKVIAAATDAALASRAEPLSKIILRRCEADTWSIELRRCVTGAATVEDVDDVCERLATKSQRDALERDLEKYDVSEDGQ